MHHVALRDLRRDAGLDRAFENPAEALCPPALSNPRQRGMVWKRLVQAVADEPPDPEVDLCLPHQPTIMNDPEQEAREHQPDGDFRIDPRSTVVLAVKIRHLRPEPGEIKDTIHFGENVVVGDELSKRAGHEQLELTAFLLSQHASASRESIADESNHMSWTSSTTPSCQTVLKSVVIAINRSRIASSSV